MTELWNWVVPALVIALIFYVTARAVMGHYFGAKERFVDKMVNKLKGSRDG